MLIFRPVSPPNLGHRRLTLDRIFVVFQRQLSELLADPDGRVDSPAAVGVDPQQGLRDQAARPVAFIVSKLDVRVEHAPLELEDPKPPPVAKLRRHRGHRLGRANFTPGVESAVAAPARIDQSRVAQDRPDDRRHIGKRDRPQTRPSRAPAHRRARRNGGRWRGAQASIQAISIAAYAAMLIACSGRGKLSIGEGVLTDNQLGWPAREPW